MAVRPASTLTRAALAAVRRGHPWVYREALARPPRDLPSGSVITLTDESGAEVAQGLWDASSPLAVRVVSLGPARGRPESVDVPLLARRLDAALTLRDRMFPAGGDTDAYRLCNGEGDRIPGLVIDRYGATAVVRLDGEAIEAWLERLVAPLRRSLMERGITTVAQRDRGRGTARLTTLAGPDAPERVVVRERGVAMEVDLWHGQKTGAFLDQRENRARVRRLAAGRGRALNLFSYAGGFSVAAALGGAGHVTSVDVASAAHATAQRTFRLNELDPSAHAFVSADAFDFLERSRARGDRFDLVVSDPPSFAPSERAKPKALAAYKRLHAAAAAVLGPGGYLCAASCSSHVTAEDFAATLDAAALGRDDLRLLELHGQPADHPTLPAWPEGRYLKLAILG